jgi:hypothetical protein
MFNPVSAFAATPQLRRADAGGGVSTEPQGNRGGWLTYTNSSPPICKSWDMDDMSFSDGTLFGEGSRGGVSLSAGQLLLLEDVSKLLVGLDITLLQSRLSASDPREGRRHAD